MKRLIYIISTFLILTGMYGGNVGAGEVFWITDQIGCHNYKIPARKFSANENQMSDSDKRSYVEWTKSSSIRGYDIALAQSLNGWVAGCHVDQIWAKRNALKNCQNHIGSTCKIVDVNRLSAFIKQVDSSGSTSTASASASTASSSGSCKIVDVNGRSAFIKQRDSSESKGNGGADSIFRLGTESSSSAGGPFDLLAGKFSGNHMPDSHKQRYLEAIWGPIGNGWNAALAVAPNGWTTGLSVRGINSAKQAALTNCRYHIKSRASTEDGGGGEGDSATESKPVAPKAEEPCNDLICGKWRINQGGYTWAVQVRPSTNPDWDFEAIWVDRGAFGYKAGDLDMRFNKVEGRYYLGESYWRTLLFAIGWGTLSLELQGKRNFIADTPCPARGPRCAGQQKLGSRIGPVPSKQRPKRILNQGERQLVGTGTGFVVNKDYIVTADHVLEDCAEVTVRHSHKEHWTDVAARDPSNDLGLLRLKRPLEHSAKLRGGKAIRLGEVISTYGYPLFGELSDSAKITQGNINSLAGIGNDSRVIQFDAPTQPGNSGGPVLDSSGNVVGVVSHGLSKKYADQSGHIAQNVNFAVKSYLVEGFLSSNNVSFEKAESTEKLELPDIAEKAEKFTVLVGCWE